MAAISAYSCVSRIYKESSEHYNCYCVVCSAVKVTAVQGHITTEALLRYDKVTRKILLQDKHVGFTALIQVNTVVLVTLLQFDLLLMCEFLI